MKRVLVIFYILTTFFSKALNQPQRIGEWRAFTNLSNVRNAIVIGSSIWAATSGGIFVYDTINNSFTKFTNIEGLSTNNVKAIAYDGSDRVWVGAEGGAVNVYNLRNKQWTTISDIANKKEITRRSIVEFSFKGDTVFIVSEFGVSVFRISSWNFGDTYNSQNFGFASAPLVSSMLYWRDSIWIGTASGIAVTSLAAPYPWKIYNSFGLTSNSVTKLQIFNDTLLVGTSKGLSYYSNGVFRVVNGTFDGFSITDIKNYDNKLSILSAFNTTTLEVRNSILSAPISIFSNNVQCNGIVAASSIWLASISGLARWTLNNQWNYVIPNGPNSNMFTSLAVDENGVLWVAPGSNVQTGFSRFNISLANDQWKNFLSSGYNYGCYRVSLGANGSVWISTWGDGVIEVRGDTIRRKLNYYSTPSLPGAKASIPTYVVTGSVAVDGDGKTWICHRVEDNNRSLLRLDSDTTATFFNNQYSVSSGWFHTLVIDQNGTKWLAGDLPWQTVGKNLFLFNERQTLSGIQSYNGWSFLSNELKSSNVVSLAVDLEGAVWIGTSVGVNIILNPTYPRQFTICYALQLYQILVQTIMVDPLNNKWIGTKEGVFVVNSDGTQLLQYYTVANTNGRLLSDDVLSIAFDKKNGIVYFGTQQGLSSLAIEAIHASKSYSVLKIGPNPFIIPYDNDDQLRIENLVANSTIKIMTIDGIVIRQIEAQGAGMARWDGRNKNGMLVPSGVYFIVVYAENGKQNAVGKVAVIRR